MVESSAGDNLIQLCYCNDVKLRSDYNSCLEARFVKFISLSVNMTPVFSYSASECITGILQIFALEILMKIPGKYWEIPNPDLQSCSKSHWQDLKLLLCEWKRKRNPSFIVCLPYLNKFKLLLVNGKPEKGTNLCTQSYASLYFILGPQERWGTLGNILWIWYPETVKLSNSIIISFNMVEYRFYCLTVLALTVMSSFATSIHLAMWVLLTRWGVTDQSRWSRSVKAQRDVQTRRVDKRVSAFSFTAGSCIML